MKTLSLLGCLVLLSLEVSLCETLPPSKANAGPALKAFFTEIEPDGKSNVPDGIRASLKQMVDSAIYITIQRQGPEMSFDSYGFYHEKEAKFQFGDPELLKSPEKKYWLISMWATSGPRVHVSLNRESYKIESVYGTLPKSDAQQGESLKP